MRWLLPLFALVGLVVAEPCADIGGKNFVLPADAVTCMKSFPFNETLRQNVLRNVARTFDFFTFEAYYPNPPWPYQDSQADIRREIARINTTKYQTDYDFHIDLYKFTTRLNDGHTRWFSGCFNAFQNILPAPAVSLSVHGRESIYIAPDSVEFIGMLGPEYLSYLSGFDWKRLAGARVVEIDGKNPWDYVDRVAREESGNFLDHGIRINSVFSGYRIAGDEYSQRLGDLAGPILLERNSLTFKLVLVNSGARVETVTVPFVAVFTGNTFTDRDSYWENNCVATAETNGRDLKGTLATSRRTQPRSPKAFIIDKGLSSAVGLPQEYHPKLAPVVGSDGVVKGYVLPDKKTGVIFVGSFAPTDFYQFQRDVVDIVAKLKAARVSKILIDVTNNGGGYVCLGVFLHSYLAGSRIGYAGFESTMRGNAFASKIVEANIRLGLTMDYSYYAPDNWAYLNGTTLASNRNYIGRGVPFRVNGRNDPTSQRFQDRCEVLYVVPLPKDPPFPLSNVAIVGNGLCASTCAMFTTVMYERHFTKIAVFGGKPGLLPSPIQFKGMAGNQVLEWADLGSEIKTADLENDPLAPPDLLVAGNFRHNWRTAWSYFDRNKPIAWLAGYPHLRYPYTPETYNNPQNLWMFAAKKLFFSLNLPIIGDIGDILPL